MSEITCHRCGTQFDRSQWHPAVYCDTTGEIYDFCSGECKKHHRTEKDDSGDGNGSLDSDN